jgi:aspartate 1-decarboxylase
MRFVLRSKIHQAVVTGANIHYQGSITIDAGVLEAADMVEFEQVHVLNLENGERFVTYIIAGERGKGDFIINGAAAHKAAVGDRIIVLSYTMMDDAAARGHKPRVVLMDGGNRAADAPQ